MTSRLGEDRFRAGINRYMRENQFGNAETTDLWDAIEAGDYPEWELGAQIFTEEQAEGFSFDVLDATKLVPEELVPGTWDIDLFIASPAHRNRGIGARAAHYLGGAGAVRPGRL